MQSNNYDIVVIGAGAAGTAAALSASETARSMSKELCIAVLERSQEIDWGGNSRWTSANFRMIDEDHLYPTFEEDMMKDSQGRADSGYVHKLVSEAIDTINWIRARGVALERRPGNWSVRGFKMGPVGGGLEIITALRKHCEELGVSIFV